MTRRQRVPTRYVLVGVTFTLSMLLYIDRVAISTVRTPVVAEFGLDDRQFGWVLSAFALGYALFQVPAGSLADRFGVRLTLALIVSLWSVFTGLTGLAWSLGSLLVFRLLFGAAEAGAYPACARAFYSWLPTSERGLAQGINNSGSRVGAALALPAVAWLVTAWGWREAFLFLGALGIVWALGWYIWFRNTPEEHPGVSESERSTIVQGRTSADRPAAGPFTLRAVVRSRNMWLAMGQYFAVNFTFYFCLTWMFPYFQQTYGLEAVTAGLMASVPLLGGAVGNWVGGAMVDALYRRGRERLSRQLPAMCGFVLSAAGLVTSLAFDQALPVLVCLTVAIFAIDMTIPPSWAFCIDIGRSRAGTVAGTMNMAGNLGAFVTSLAFPYLLAFTGSPRPFFFVAAALNVIAAGLWLGARPDVPIEETTH